MTSFRTLKRTLQLVCSLSTAVMGWSMFLSSLLASSARIDAAVAVAVEAEEAPTGAVSECSGRHTPQFADDWADADALLYDILNTN